MALVAVLASLGGCGPPDGVTSIAWSLGAAQNLVLPPADDLGVPITPSDFAPANGLCAVTLATRAVACSFTGLPLVAVTVPGPEYRVTLGIGPHAVTAQTYGHVHPAVSSIDLGRLEVDAVGRGSRGVAGVAGELGWTAGGTLDVVLTATDGTARHYPVLEGTVGNLVTTATPTPTPAGGAHMH